MSKSTSKNSITDDSLLLYYYEDGLDDVERGRISDAIAADPVLHERYRRLTDGLGRLGSEPPSALRPDRLQRFHDALDRAADQERSGAATATSRVHMPSFAWGAALVAALALGIALGIQLGKPGDTEIDPGAPAGPRTVAGDGGTSGALIRGVRVHLRDSRDELAGMGTLGDADRVLLVADMIRQNRVFESAAAQQGDEDLARVLRAFELVLARLAEERLDPSRADTLRTQLSLEMNAMLTKLAPDASIVQEAQSERT